MPKLFKLDYTPETGYELDVENRLDKCQRYVDLRGKLILDLGCGDGKYAKQIIDHSGAIIGFDIEHKALSLARRFCSDVVLGDAERLPFNDNAFDVVLLADILEHVSDDKVVVREVFRCLKRGG